MPTTAIEEAVEVATTRVPTALRTIQSYYGLRNEDVAALIDKQTNWVQERTSGKRSCKVEDLFRFAAGLEVPAEIRVMRRWRAWRSDPARSVCKVYRGLSRLMRLIPARIRFA